MGHVTLTRREDWPERLAHSVDAARKMPWYWGESDCCTWVASVVEEITGHDFASDLRGRYFDAQGADETLRSLGGIVRMVTAFLGRSVPVDRARRGDVVIARMPAGLALGICTGTSAAFRAEGGIDMVPMSNCRRAWRVG